MLETSSSSYQTNFIAKKGAVFYSGRSAWAKPSDLYFLGLNPHGTDHTISDSLKSSITNRSEELSAYKDEDWGKGAGKYPLQLNILHMCRVLGVDPRSLPASNLFFVGSSGFKEIRKEAWRLAALCMPFHEAVIKRLGVKVLICLGTFADLFLTEMFELPQKPFSEMNNPETGHWIGWARRRADGLVVACLQHPSAWNRPDWLQPSNDPTYWLRGVVDFAAASAQPPSASV